MTKFTEQIDVQMFTFYVLVHVCGLVARVKTDGAAPNLPPCIVNCLKHLLLNYQVQL